MHEKDLVGLEAIEHLQGDETCGISSQGFCFDIHTQETMFPAARITIPKLRKPGSAG